MEKINNFKWSWCWECNSPTIELGKENICCARWFENPHFQFEAWEWGAENPSPDSPTPNEIDKQLDCDLYTQEEKLICETFDAFSYGKYYWLPKHWADKIGHQIPTYEELCEKYGFQPKYDCKTGKQWQIDEKKNVFDKQGWKSEESFENDEIPYREFCRRIRISKIKNDETNA